MYLYDKYFETLPYISCVEAFEVSDNHSYLDKV